MRYIRFSRWLLRPACTITTTDKCVVGRCQKKNREKKRKRRPARYQWIARPTSQWRMENELESGQREKRTRWTQRKNWEYIHSCLPNKHVNHESDPRNYNIVNVDWVRQICRQCYSPLTHKRRSRWETKKRDSKKFSFFLLSADAVPLWLAVTSVLFVIIFYYFCFLSSNNKWECCGERDRHWQYSSRQRWLILPSITEYIVAFSLVELRTRKKKNNWQEQT